jgi:hypothetical protein
MKYIILNQFGRRNLSLGNRSLLALRLEPLYKAQAKTNQQISPGRGKKGSLKSANLFPMDTRKKIAGIAGVSPDTISKVSRIVEKGTPEQVKRIKEGGKGNSVSAVFEEIRRLAAPPPLSSADSKAIPPSSLGDTASLEDEAVTATMLAAEYEELADRVVGDVGDFCNDPYREAYPLLTPDQRNRMKGHSGAMIRAIERQISLIREADP